MKVGFQGGSKMYRVEWIDSEGDIRTIKGFKTNVEAREYINQMSKYFDKFAYPEVFRIMNRGGLRNENKYNI